MDAIYIDDLQKLAHDKTRMCVSIYMTTHPTCAEGEQDPLRWRKLVQDAEHDLLDRSMRLADAKAFLTTAHNLPNDSAFWQNRSKGLAAFISPQTWSCSRVPRPFDDLVVVNRRFQIRQLLPLLPDGRPFYILALSQKNVRLFKASHFHIEQVEVAGLPAAMKEVLNYTSVDRGSQVHSAMKGRLGKQAAVFHGQGGKWDTRKDELAEFFRFVGDAIQPALTAQPAPLLLAGVEYLLPIYRGVNGFAQLLDQQLKGNCDYLTPSQLPVQAWTVMESALSKDRNEAVIRYTDLLGTGRATHDIELVLRAAHEGRIDVLFVDPRAAQWGEFNAANGTARVHHLCRAGDEDLLELAIAETLSKKGTVYPADAEQLPGNPSIAALLRY